MQAAPKQVPLSFGRTGVVIVGGGPVGLAPLLAAHRGGRLPDPLREGITVVEESDAVGEGSIGRWCINSDSTGFTLQTALPSAHKGAVKRIQHKLISWQTQLAW